MSFLELAELRCPHCQGDGLEIDEEKQRIHCPWCDSDYMYQVNRDDGKLHIAKLISSATANYGGTVFNIGSIGSFNVSDRHMTNRLIKNAEDYLTILENYDRARELFEKATYQAPKDYRGWWGLVRVDNFNLNAKAAYENGTDPYEYEEESEYFQNAMKVASDSVEYRLTNQWEAYLDRYDRYTSEQEAEELRAKISLLDSQIKEANQNIAASVGEYSEKSVEIVGSILGVIALFMLLSGGMVLWNWILFFCVALTLYLIFKFNAFNVTEYFFEELRNGLREEREKISEWSRERAEAEKKNSRN